MQSHYPEARFFRSADPQEIWQRYCGFLDLNVEKFMEIQSYLLMEQVKVMANTPIGEALLRGKTPATVGEFRRIAPVVGYEAYAPYIGQQQEGCLPEKPYFWCHSAGRGGDVKWVPYTRNAFDRIARYAVAVGILSAADERGQVRTAPGDRLLLNLTRRPYASGSLMYHFAHYLPVRFIPPLEVAEGLDFQGATEAAYRMALDQGVDYIFSMSTVLMKIAEIFEKQEQRLKITSAMLRPRALGRMGRAWLRSRLGRRPMMPKDLWSPKGIVTFGVDTSIYEEEIARVWGKVPYQVYGTTEMLIAAVQAWNKKAMTFLPDVAFWEFIPQNEWQKSREDPEYQPRTALMDEVEIGKQYELVYTHFYGMPLLRYRAGDVFKVVSKEDPETGVRLPQMVYQARTSEIIDLAGLTQIDEKTLWKALANTGVNYEEWCARKEYDRGAGYLRVYLELKEERKSEEVEGLLEEQLRAVDVDYRDLEGWLGQKRSVRITLLAPGTFTRYYEEKKGQGAPLVRQRPPHINPEQDVTERLLELSPQKGNGS